MNTLKENMTERDLELLEKEVNIYMEDCGAMKLDCVTDCFAVSPLITTQE